MEKRYRLLFHNEKKSIVIIEETPTFNEDYKTIFTGNRLECIACKLFLNKKEISNHESAKNMIYDNKEEINKYLNELEISNEIKLLKQEIIQINVKSHNRLIDLQYLRDKELESEFNDLLLYVNSIISKERLRNKKELYFKKQYDMYRICKIDELKLHAKPH